MQAILNGSINGISIALLALAFMLVYSGTNIFYVALAGIYTIVPYIIKACIEEGFSSVSAILIGCCVGVLISISCEIFNHWPLEKKKVTWAAHLISSLAIYIVLVQVVTIVWGSEMITLGTGYYTFTLWGDLKLSISQLVTLLGSLLTIIVFLIWLMMSRIGLQIRALASNPTELSLFGYNIRMVRIVLFGNAGLLASLAAYFSAIGLGGFDANSGLDSVFIAYCSLIIGGKDRFSGAILGGIVLGNIRSLTILFFSSRWKEPVTFALLAFFLLFWPQGMLGQKNRTIEDS